MPCKYCKREKCICNDVWKEIKKGKTYEEAAKIFHLGMRSGVIDFLILKILEEEGAATVGHISNMLGKDLYHRIRRMLSEKEIEITRIPKVKSLEKYYNQNVFYINEDGFRKWVKSKVPDNILFLKTLRRLGLSGKAHRTINISLDIYNEVQRKAMKKGITTKDMIEDILIKEAENG